MSFAYPLSNVGFNAGDPGGMDAGFGYAFDRTHRITAGYYEIQQVPVGFSNKNVPFYLQGFTGPGSNLPGASLGTVNTGVVDATTKDKIFQVGLQNLFVIGNKLPIVITPTYLAHTATIGGHSDEQLIEFNGFPTTVRLRTEQEWLLPVTLPFLSTPRMFGTFTAAPQWLVHPGGVNQTNHVQLFLLGYLEYRANKQTTFFVQPSRLVQYNPVDPYPEYTPDLDLRALAPLHAADVRPDDRSRRRGDELQQSIGDRQLDMSTPSVPAEPGRAAVRRPQSGRRSRSSSASGRRR